jgi:hypothetical protein
MAISNATSPQGPAAALAPAAKDMLAKMTMSGMAWRMTGIRVRPRIKRQLTKVAENLTAGALKIGLTAGPLEFLQGMHEGWVRGRFDCLPPRYAMIEPNY